MSAKVKHTTDEIILHVTSVPHRFSPAKASRNDDELQERVLSFSLGYNYPYLSGERPRCQRHKSEEMIIDFLYRHRHALVCLLLAFFNKAPEGEKEVDGTTDEEDIQHSVFFQAFQSFCTSLRRLSDQEKEQMKEQVAAEYCSNGHPCSPDQVTEDMLHQTLVKEKAEQVLALINGWHGLLETGSTSALNAELINFLLPFRYRNSKSARRMEQLKQNFDEWQRVLEQIDSFQQLYSEHGEELFGANPLSKEAKTWIPKH